MPAAAAQASGMPRPQSRLIALDFQRKESVGPGSTSNETEHQGIFEIVFLAFAITGRPGKNLWFEGRGRPIGDHLAREIGN